MWNRDAGISLDGTARAASLKTLLLAALIALGFAAFAARAQATLVPVTIDYPSFSAADESGLQLNGSAIFAGSALRLTPAETGQSGTAFSRTEIQPAGSFETEFELYMHETGTPYTYGPADGIAFVLQPESDLALGEKGGSMGYQGIEPSAEVEFDLYRDPYDPPTPNVSFMENGNPENHLAESQTPLPFELYGEPVWGWVDYDAETTELAVYAAPSSTKPSTPLFTYKVNLAELLHSEYTYAGFTSGTGSGDAIQEVLNWQLTSTSKVEIAPPVETPPTTTTHGSATSVTCNLIVATASDTCIATVADVDVPAAIAPTGTVSFTSASGGVFSAGNTCNLVPTNGDIASCTVQFLPPTAASTLPSITATYGGDPHHSASSGHTYYGPAGSLSGDVEVSNEATTSANGSTVTVPVNCQFPCSINGSLLSGPDDPGAGMASFAGLGGDTATIAKAKKPSKKKTAKPVVFGTGSLTLSKPGKGTLTIKLNGKAKLAFKQAKGKSIKALLEVTVKTPNGTLVKTEKLTVTIRPAKKPKKKSGKHGK